MNIYDFMVEINAESAYLHVNTFVSLDTKFDKFSMRWYKILRYLQIRKLNICVNLFWD